MILRQDPKAWKEGFAVGQQGRPGLFCPYLPNSDLSWAWHSGWIEGNAKWRQDACARRSAPGPTEK
ncbi:ribosome modulation factor [Cupriavidus sp. BIC8F]|uniref:ribosome modulation factor n=1 Tax=Cupriavidus sp. BIC8F TaxID=3079014 RepID=UPI003CCDA602